MFTALLLNLALLQSAQNPNNPVPAGTEGAVYVCMQQCVAWYDAPSAELKACVAQCQLMAKP